MKSGYAFASLAVLALALTAGGVALANNVGPSATTPARADNFRLVDNNVAEDSVPA
jgi:hypothetical protein